MTNLASFSAKQDKNWREMRHFGVIFKHSVFFMALKNGSFMNNRSDRQVGVSIRLLLTDHYKSDDFLNAFPM